VTAAWSTYEFGPGLEPADTITLPYAMLRDMGVRDKAALRDKLKNDAVAAGYDAKVELQAAHDRILITILGKL
jgi:hypothetical protein